MASRSSHVSAARRTIAQLVRDDRLDRRRDAVVVRTLETLAGELDALADRETVECPRCELPVDVGPSSAAMVRLARELRAWWTAVRAPKEVSPGANVVDLFADGDAAARDRAAR